MATASWRLVIVDANRGVEVERIDAPSRNMTFREWLDELRAEVMDELHDADGMNYAGGRFYVLNAAGRMVKGFRYRTAI